MIKKFLKRSLISATIIYCGICILVYFAQEKIIFHPEKLDADYAFNINGDYQEFTLMTDDNEALNALLFKADSSKGVVIHYHGNSGNIAHWENRTSMYTDLGYDFFIMDYRGFGKSSGSIESETQLFEDAQLFYDTLLTYYDEANVIIEGYSVGSGIAAEIALNNKPKQLLLLAPYYGLKDLMRHTYPVLPTFLLKYPLATYERIPNIKVPITIFHGDEDQVIPFNSSERLSKLIKDGDSFIPLDGCGHNAVQSQEGYLEELFSYVCFYIN
ncbi:MAG: alpha/beta fold hydrolase [Crocinitomix sp.]|nr:alpha/beta fold hydrolase [Crocinitomix sp.]